MIKGIIKKYIIIFLIISVFIFTLLGCFLNNYILKDNKIGLTDSLTLSVIVPLVLYIPASLIYWYIKLLLLFDISPNVKIRC